jgi:uncharacterized protein (DUF58 family)
MIPAEVLKKIRRIQIKTARLVTDVFAGQYESVFKGRGIEFDEVREYYPGDDVRSIDWNVTARTGHPYIKKFIEERQLTMMLLLDASGSCRFGTVNRLKSELIAQLCAVLAFSAIKNNDKVGLIIFTDRIEKVILAKKGLRHVLRVIKEALYYRPDSVGTDIPAALEYLDKITPRRTVSFLISDFITDEDALKKPLSIANKRHDMIAVYVRDPRESYLPKVGIVGVRGSETGQQIEFDTRDDSFLDKYKKMAREQFEKRQRVFKSIGVDCINVSTDKPYTEELIKFFRKRERRFR